MGLYRGVAVTTNGMAKHLACLRLARLDLIREAKEGPSCGTNLAGLELLGTVLACQDLPPLNMKTVLSLLRDTCTRPDAFSKSAASACGLASLLSTS